MERVRRPEEPPDRPDPGERAAEELARIRRLLVGIVVVAVLIVVGVLIYNDSKRDSCREDGKEPTSGLVVSCKESSGF
jgi:hypothetical protein